ncbi:nucleoside 2-deoxyribosyltransferase [Leptospira idonii]|uniref:Nucleoside 2-deoxyribosyltransferase n=1 Tax=Leptospira idonii TaxID=1193500 RepID=A0A4R9M2M0_9LEPT|nr:nucleoside 2-deoxyribosyltransferase [Leptospira idonii]TGN21034.1 nucleoside 2-deoxyribosyltransferase [Leptospira idonii]
MPISIYLAGPEVFFPNGFEILKRHREKCEAKGFIAYTPFDGELPPHLPRDLSMAKRIFESNCELIRKSDRILANCNFFRGACVDDGTSFEIGYGFSLGKEIWGYRSDLTALHLKTAEVVPTSFHDSGFRMDQEGYLLNEDFGNSINLMLEFSILQSQGKLILGDFSSALEEMAKQI